MSFLVDTNVISETRKGTRCDPHVAAWAAGVDPNKLFISVLVLGEMRRGAELLRRKHDIAQAASLDAWIAVTARDFGDRVLVVDDKIADAWGVFMARRPLPIVDGLLAATAIVHDLTLVTRNIKDVHGTGVRTLNPFSR